MTRRLAVFDCDGTLVDGQGSICTAMDRAFAACGLPLPDRAQVRRYVGLSLPIAMRQLLPDADDQLHRDLAEQYKTAYRAAREAGELAEPLYPGIAELIVDLHGAGWLLGVATGKSDRGLSHVLASHGLSGFFITLQTSDRHPSKPHPAMIHAALAETGVEPSRAMIVGDTVFDVEMGRAAGILAIGVAWGYHPADRLVAAGAESVVADHADLMPTLARHLGR